MLDRRAFLLSGLAAYSVSARELFAAGPALQNPRFPTLAVHAGGVLRRPGTRRGRPLDTACARPVEWRRHAPPADLRAVAGRDRRPNVARCAFGNGDGVTRLGALGSRRSHRARAAPLVLVPVPRRQRDESHRPDAHVSACAVRRRSAPVRHRVVPAFRGRPVHGVPAHGRGRSRSGDAPGRLHLRKPGPRQSGAQTRRRRAADDRRLSQSLRPVPQRSGASRGARLLSLSGRMGRSRGRQQLRRPQRRERHAGGAIRLAPRGGLQGLLRAHAPAALVDTERRAAAALSSLHLRDTRRHFDARYPSVPHRPAVRRQRSASVCRRDGSACDVPGTPHRKSG